MSMRYLLPGNRRRVKDAHKALAEYRQGNENQEALIDLLTDLLHWSEHNNVNFHEQLRKAETHHLIERHHNSKRNES